ncbi:MAG: hypothetical protein HY318_07665 [Armatimonadetes bacterium]|nr:hypothetical protein [Armatimonadota bacterium]
MKRLWIPGLLLLRVCSSALAAGQNATRDYINVCELGAKGDGKADDTRAFLAAVATAAKERRPVYVPRGRYLLSKPVDLENVALTGPDAGAWPADVDALPVLVPTQTNAPCMILRAGAALKGVGITYEWKQDPQDGPPAVLIKGIGVYISGVKIMYAWDGIITDGESNVGRLNIENVFMVSPRNIGVRVTGTWDVPALRNIEVWNAGPVPRGLEKGIGFHLGKNDLIRLTDCFVFGMRYGFLLEDKMPGCKIEGGTWGVMTGCSTDFCGAGIVVRGEHTVSISGGTYWDHAESLVVDGEKARVRLNGAELKSNGAPALVVRECDHVVVTGCSLLRPMKEYDPPAVLLEGGRIVVSDNHIEAYGVGARVGPKVRSAILRGNLIDAHGRPAVLDEHGPDAQVLIEGNLEERTATKRPEQ